MGTSDDWFMADGSDPNSLWHGFAAPSWSDYQYGVRAFGWRAGVYGQAGKAAGPDTKSSSVLAGVVGTSSDGIGVRGTSFNNVGVYGQNGGTTIVPGGLQAGVLGSAESEPGVIGASIGSPIWSKVNDGIWGITGDEHRMGNFPFAALYAVSFYGPGTYALSGADVGVWGVQGYLGPQVPNIAYTAGVTGSSNPQSGVIGTSNALFGVYGFSNNNVGVVGQTTNPASYAGYFAGNVGINGSLTATVKNAVVAFPDGTQRVLHCMESPEHWFEDFGTAKLKSGRAVVALDADFAKVIKRGDYRVLVTPKDDCRGLCVRRKGPTSFEVRELRGGTSSIAFSYRIAGRRKDIKAHRRFAKIDMRPPLPAAARRPPRKPAPTRAALRAFMARLQKEARARAAKSHRVR